jgi:ketosteroid isomerase-like protein
MMFLSHIARNAILWTLVAIMTSTTRAESDTSEAFAPVRQYIDAFNKADVKAMSSLFAVPGVILDGMAPHLWQGPTASQDWYRDVLTEGEHLGANGYFVTLGEPRHVNVTRDAAYVVVPATMTFKLRGQQVTQTGATYVVALRRLPEGWRIAAWAWAKWASK